jgi:TRAP-type transport system periplasmic protein
VYFDRVEQASKGQLKFERSFDGQVVNFRTSLSGIKDGLVDATFFLPSFYLSDVKAMNTFVDMAAYAPDPWAHTAAIAETVLLECPQCDAEFARHKLKPLAVSGSGPFMLMCKNPATSLGDLKGKTIRAMSAFQVLTKAAGANPTGTAPSEVFEAMQRGQVECAAGGLDWMQQVGLADVAKNVLDQPIGHDDARVPLALNADVWRRLSPAQKDAMLRSLPFLTAESIANNLADTRSARQMAEGKGVRFNKPAADFSTFLENHRKTELDRIARDAGQRGVDKPDALLSTFKTKMAKWQAIVAETGGDRARYEEALWREVYSKLK